MSAVGDVLSPAWSKDASSVPVTKETVDLILQVSQGAKQTYDKDEVARLLVQARDAGATEGASLPSAAWWRSTNTFVAVGGSLLVGLTIGLLVGSRLSK